MEDKKKALKLDDESLEGVSGGCTREELYAWLDTPCDMNLNGGGHEFDFDPFGRIECKWCHDVIQAGYR